MTWHLIFQQMYQIERKESRKGTKGREGSEQVSQDLLKQNVLSYTFLDSEWVLFFSVIENECVIINVRCDPLRAFSIINV